jgi:hypothetical protein
MFNTVEQGFNRAPSQVTGAAQPNEFAPHTVLLRGEFQGNIIYAVEHGVSCCIDIQVTVVD